MSVKEINFTVIGSADEHYSMWKTLCMEMEKSGRVKDLKCSDADGLLYMRHGKSLMNRGCEVTVKITPDTNLACYIHWRGSYPMTILQGTAIACIFNEFIMPFLELFNQRVQDSPDLAHTLVHKQYFSAYQEAHEKMNKGFL